MPTAFSSRADFSGLSNAERYHIDQVVHQTFIQVNEKGTEAAGATGVLIEPDCAPLRPQFRADHPFLFLIRDNLTGSILFLGRVTDPTQS